MIISKGIYYRTVEDVIDVMYKPEAAKHLENLFNNGEFGPERMSQVSREIIWTFDNFDIPSFRDKIYIEAIPQEVMMNKTHLEYLTQMRKDVLLNPPGITKMGTYIDEMIDGIKTYFGEIEYIFSTGAVKITEQPCYIWLWKVTPENTYEFCGVFSGIPVQLLEKILNKSVIYECSECDYFEATEEEIPNFYYDKNNNLYCKNCAEKKKGLRHIGE